jgi:hypothetical protein
MGIREPHKYKYVSLVGDLNLARGNTAAHLLISIMPTIMKEEVMSAISAQLRRDKKVEPIAVGASLGNESRLQRSAQH